MQNSDVWWIADTSCHVAELQKLRGKLTKDKLDQMAPRVQNIRGVVILQPSGSSKDFIVYKSFKNVEYFIV